MPNLPASGLSALLARLLQVNSRDAGARRSAIAGFQQLHTELRHWNEEFVRALRAYPGFVQSNAPAEYDRFLDRLAACRDALGEGDGSSDAAGMLRQNARNTADFLGQLAAEAGPYPLRRPRVMDAIRTYEAASALAFADLRMKAAAANVNLSEPLRPAPQATEI